MADSSDYKADKSDYGENSEEGSSSTSPLRSYDDMADVPVTEEIPVPMSRNNVGNRFLALVFDRSLSRKHDEKGWKNEEVERDDDGEQEGEHILWEMHEDRVALTEEHVMWARKQNLYDDTFNTESMADILWSHQL